MVGMLDSRLGVFVWTPRQVGSPRAPEAAASTQTSIAAIATRSDRQSEGDGPRLAGANVRGAGEVDSEVTSIPWLTARFGDDKSGLRDGPGDRLGTVRWRFA